MRPVKKTPLRAKPSGNSGAGRMGNYIVGSQTHSPDKKKQDGENNTSSDGTGEVKEKHHPNGLSEEDTKLGRGW